MRSQQRLVKNKPITPHPSWRMVSLIAGRRDHSVSSGWHTPIPVPRLLSVPTAFPVFLECLKTSDFNQILSLSRSPPPTQSANIHNVAQRLRGVSKFPCDLPPGSLPDPYAHTPISGLFLEGASGLFFPHSHCPECCIPSSNLPRTLHSGFCSSISMENP